MKTLLVTGLLAGLFLGAEAGAATVSASGTLGGFSYEIVDLTPDDGVAAWGWVGSSGDGSALVSSSTGGSVYGDWGWAGQDLGYLQLGAIADPIERLAAVGATADGSRSVQGNAAASYTLMWTTLGANSALRVSQTFTGDWTLTPGSGASFSAQLNASLWGWSMDWETGEFQTASVDASDTADLAASGASGSASRTLGIYLANTSGLVVDGSLTASTALGLSVVGAVPEPDSLALGATAGLALLPLLRRRRPRG
ncbi:hypothetical protein [Derxia lacustris]|uniref:hypothetical protein n=1 Tax=Derxia lacustris TaxID=764842 RepID=UPI000A170C70|nr:hypothetical protein [Derxia lacustris]